MSNCKHFPDADDHCLVCAKDEETIECSICGEDVPASETDGDACESCLEREHQKQERTY